MQERLFTRLQADFRLCTPAFIGGPDGKTPRLDAKAIKSALRYWWRVLHASGIDENTSDARALHQLHQRETELFGGTAEGSGQGWLQVLLKTKESPISEDIVDNQKKALLKHGLKYLMGQGLYGKPKKTAQKNGKKDKESQSEDTQQQLRPCITESDFTIELILFPRDSKKMQQALQETISALHAFGLLGNIGSRKSRGFGSVQLIAIRNLDSHSEKYACQTFCENAAEYKKKLIALLDGKKTASSLLPAFNKNSRCLLLHGQSVKVPKYLNETNIIPAKRDYQEETAKHCLHLQSIIGEQLLLFRSWGHKCKETGFHKTSGGKYAEHGDDKDHNLIKYLLGDTNYINKKRNPIIFRSVFGLPLNYGYKIKKTNEKTTMGMNLQPSKDVDVSRRASPLHIHLCEFNNEPLAVLYTLPSRFAPQASLFTLDQWTGNDKVSSPYPVKEDEIDWNLLTEFLARFSNATPIL